MRALGYSIILLSLLALSCSAYAQETSDPYNYDLPVLESGESIEPQTSDLIEVDSQTQKINQLQQSNQVLEQVIRNLIERIETLERAAQSPEKDAQSDQKITEKIQQQIEENEALINRAFEQRLNKQGSMLLAPGQFVYEPGLTLAHSSYDTIVVDGYTVYPVLVVGDIVSERVKRHVITNNHTLRFGLPSNLQLDLVIPIGYEKQRLFREDGTTSEFRTEGFGDMSIGLSYQWIASDPDWPDTVVAFNWKTKTGDDPYRLEDSDDLTLGNGFHTYGLSLTSMSNNDPIVMFGGLSITYTEDDAKPVGRVKPGIGYGINLGMALALNFDTSLSFSLQLVDTEKTRIDGQIINGSDTTTGSFAIGFSTSRGDGDAIDLDLGIGLTSDSPDFQLTVSFPFNFKFN